MGKHHKQVRIIKAAGTTAITAAVIVAACGGVANAAPTQGGVTTAPSTQGGVTTAPSAPSTQGGVTTAPSAPVETWVPVPVQYQGPTQQLNNWDYQTNTYVAPAYQPNANYNAPVDYSQIHLPTQLEEFTAPIQAPEKKIRVGKFLMDQPNWVSDDTAARTNGQTAVIEAQVTDFWRSTGLETDEAQRLAAAQLGFGVAGAISGGLAAAAPASLVGGTLGAWAGGTAGLAIGNFLVPLPVVGAVPATIVGSVGGGAVGAAVLGAPAFVLGAVGGGASGVLAATAYGTGDLGEPIETTIPDIDEPAITAQTQATLDQWETNPVGAAASGAVRDVVASAPVVDEQIRSAVTSVPGGTQALSAFDQGVADFQKATGVAGLPLGMIANAIGTGIPA
ncbi:UNVERIFIED_ORG: hypothetical protein FNL38_11184 [Nocardia globerula]|uniref:Insoluble domain protein n=1 Tax=Nocardia globerula TaxID=1818 RepID=A0A652YIA9_NOCGL|nr:insoluble domain protein [Nocardia globerula]